MVSPGSSEPFSAVKNQPLRAASVPLSQNAKQVDKPAVTDFPDVVKPEPVRDHQQVQRHASFDLAHSINFVDPVEGQAPSEANVAPPPLTAESEARAQQFLAQVRSAQAQGYSAVDVDPMQKMFQAMGVPMSKEVAIAASQMTEVFAVPVANDTSSPPSVDDLEARLQASYARLMNLNPGSNLHASLSPEQQAQKAALLSEVESLRKQLADRLSEQVLSAQASGSELDARRLGFEGAMAAIGNLDQGSGLTDAMQRIAKGESLDGLQLNTQGGSNVALNLLRRIQPGLQNDGTLGLRTQQTQQTRQEMEKLANWSRELLEGRFPDFSPQDLELLSDLGIGVQGGRLINIGDGQALSPDVIRNLGHLATCTGIALSVSGGLTPANVAMRDFLTKLTTAQEALDKAAQSRERLTLITERVEMTTAEVEQRTQIVDSTTEQLNDKQQQATVLADDLAITADAPEEDAPTTFVPGPTAPPVGGQPGPEQTRRGRRAGGRVPFWERPDPAGRRAEALGRMGLRVTGDPGQPRQFFVDNRAVDERTFARTLQQRRETGFGRLAVLQQDIETLGVQLRRQRQDLAASTERLARERRHLQTAEAEYQQDVAHANDATTDLEDFRRSPAWDLLPPEAQAAADPLVQGVRAQMDRENALAPQVLARSQAADQGAEAALQRAQVSLQRSAQALQQAEDLDARLEEILAARKAHYQAGAEIRAEVDALIREADRLQGELELMVAPNYVGVEQLFESWRVSLAEVQHIFQRLATEQMMADAQDALTTRVNTDRMREGLAYHQKQLEQLDQQQKARMVDVLSQSSDWLKQALPALANAS